MKLLARMTILAAALTSSTAAPAATPPAPAAPAPAAKAGALKLPDVKSWTLDNGLAVYYLGVHDAPVVTVQVFYHVGSKDEPRDARGTAHMFEHMMFKGTEHVRPEEHARMIDELGGDTNAFTAWDVTGFHDTLPREHLDFAVQLEAERMRGLLFRKSMIQREVEVVKQEKRMRDQSPLSRAVDELSALAFTRHPYAWSAAGEPAELDKLTPESLKAFYDTYYQPGNAALVVVGDVSEADVKAAAEKWFGKIAKGAAPPRPADAATEPPQTEERDATSDKAAQVGIVIGGYRIPASKHPDMVAIKLAASILTDGESSRIKQRIVRKDKLGVGAGGQVLALEQPGMFFVFAAHLKPEQAQKCAAAIVDEIAKLGASGPTAQELDKAKNQMTARFVFGLESVGGLAQQIGMSWINTGDGRAFLKDYDAIQAVSAADVKRVVKTYLTRNSLTLMTVPPFAGGGQ
jgi:zinc protease